MSRLIKIFDTTLRDGEQSPGASMTSDEKLMLARQLARLNVDIIEAGFAFSSQSDFEALQRIAGEVEGPIICSLARAKPGDIDRAWDAVKGAPKRRIHTFLSTSDIHLQHQFKLTRDEALKQSVEMVQRAKGHLDDVEFSPMDATRSDLQYLYDVLTAVIEAGATTLNIPDTVGYVNPQEFGALIRGIREHVTGIENVVISVHCHNDLGLAVANSLAAVAGGAGQVECTINGIGGRAGNASLEEVVMGLRVRSQWYDADTTIVTEEIMKTSRLTSKTTGLPVQPNKAIVGANAFAHTSGIHQDGLLKDGTTYEIMRPQSVGLGKSTMVMGKLSGRHAFRNHLEEMGYTLSDDELDGAFQRFKHLAEQKKEIFVEDIESIISEEVQNIPSSYTLKHLRVESGTDMTPTATIELEIDGTVQKHTDTGDGPVDACYKAIDGITKLKGELLDYSIHSVTRGKDALGEVMVKVKINKKSVIAYGTSTDILEASAKAYINAINKVISQQAG